MCCTYKKLLIGNAIGFGSCCCLITILSIFVIFPVLMSFSFNKVSEGEWAIKYYDISNEIVEDNILEAGLHYDSKPDTTLLIYPSIYTTLDFTGNRDIHCLSSDSLDMTLSITLQYKLLKEDLYDILWEFGDYSSINKYVSSICEESIMIACGEFTAEQFFTQRQDIENRISEILNETIATANTHSIFGFIQVKNIKHPDAFAQANQAKQIAEQDKDKSLNERSQSITEATTQYLLSLETQKIGIINATATANATIFDANKTAAATESLWIERALSFNDTLSKINFNASEFNFYLDYLTFKDNKENIIHL